MLKMLAPLAMVTRRQRILASHYRAEIAEAFIGESRDAHAEAEGLLVASQASKRRSREAFGVASIWDEATKQ
jgi:hypothetical protein